MGIFSSDDATPWRTPATGRALVVVTAVPDDDLWGMEITPGADVEDIAAGLARIPAGAVFVEHFNDIGPPIAEQLRVLRPGGLLWADIVTDRFSVDSFSRAAGALRAMRKYPAALAPKPSQGNTATFSRSSNACANSIAPSPVQRTSSNTNMPPSGGTTRQFGAVASIRHSVSPRVR